MQERNENMPQREFKVYRNKDNIDNLRFDALSGGIYSELFSSGKPELFAASLEKEVRQKSLTPVQNVSKATSSKPTDTDNNKNPANTKAIINNMLSGMISGTVIAYTTFPLEGLKKWLQAMLDAKKNNTEIDPNNKFKPYRGSTVFAANIIPTTTIQFLTNHAISSFLPASPSVWQNIGASIFSGITGAVTATFVENTIARQHAMKSGPIIAIKDMFKVGPLRAWKSYPHIATRDGIFTFSMFWAVPEAIKWVNTNIGEGYDTATRFTVSALGAALSHPVDTIGTLLQKTHEKKSTFNIAKNLLAEKGVTSFFKGYVPRLAIFGIFSNALPELHQFVEKNIVNRETPASDNTQKPRRS